MALIITSTLTLLIRYGANPDPNSNPDPYLDPNPDSNPNPNPNAGFKCSEAKLFLRSNLDPDTVLKTQFLKLVPDYARTQVGISPFPKPDEPPN